MADVEQRDTAPKPLELYDTFKIIDEDKDSDEESFHLPLLDNEDDSIGKDTSKTEEELLNGSEDESDHKVNSLDTTVGSVSNEKEDKNDDKQEFEKCNGNADETAPIVNKEEVQSVTCNIAVLVQSEINEKTEEKVDEVSKVDTQVEKESTSPSTQSEEDKPAPTEDEAEPAEEETKLEDEDKPQETPEVNEEETALSDEVEEKPEEASDPIPEEDAVEKEDEQEPVLPEPMQTEPIPEFAATTQESDIANKEKETDQSDNKDDNLERDDLLDISLIRDVDEDNAKAAADAQGSYKSDNDDHDDHDQADQTSETDQDQEMEEEVEPEQTADTDFGEEEESNTHNNSETETPTEKESESESVLEHEISKVEVSEMELSEVEEKSESVQVAADELLPPSEVSEEPLEVLDLDKHMAELKKSTQDQQTSHSGKRSLSEDSTDTPTKKPKISTDEPTATEIPRQPPKMLNTFEKLMSGKPTRKLTMADLEQITLQKCAEYVMNVGPIGEQYQLNKRYEKEIEALRKENQLVKKQVKDLEVVNRKLINELRTMNGAKKPLVPLKITRSVGLQVKLTANSFDPVKRRAPPAPVQKQQGVVASPTLNASPGMNNRARNANNAQGNAARASYKPIVPVAVGTPRKLPPNQTTPIKTTPPTPMMTTMMTSKPASTNTTLLSQVLQSAPKTPPQSQQQRTVTAAKRTTNATSNTNNNNSNNRSKDIIDLTDEDAPAGTQRLQMNRLMVQVPQQGQKVRGPIAANGSPRGIALTPGMRFTSTPMKNGIAIPTSIVSTNTSGTTQLMYVVQPSQLVSSTAGGGAPKAVLLNFQPNNGILTSALNNQTVSMIPTKPISSPVVQMKTISTQRKIHPAPLPPMPPTTTIPNLKPVLPKPHLTIRKTDTGIILQWRMPYKLDTYENIASYQLYAYQETASPPSTDMWRKVGDVKALALPMACTLTQFADKNKYYFAVRSVDVYKRIGAFSDPEEISL